MHQLHSWSWRTVTCVKGIFTHIFFGISGAQIHLMQWELARCWEERKSNWKQRRDENWPIPTAKRCLPTVSLTRLFTTRKEPDHVPGTIQQPRIVVLVSTGTTRNGDDEPNYWSEEMFSVLSAAAHWSIFSWVSHGLTFGLPTRFHSLAPLWSQLSCRNAGNGVNPAKPLLLHN